MEQILQILLANGYAEDDICMQLNMMHTKFRSIVYSGDISIPLTKGAIAEIRAINPDMNKKAVAHHYYTSLNEAHKALYSHPMLDLTGPTPLEVAAAWNSRGTIKGVAEVLKLSEYRAKRILQDDGYISRRPQMTEEEKALAIKLIEADTPQYTIAALLNRAISTISAIAKASGNQKVTRGKYKKLSPTTWGYLLSEYKRGASITDLARDFGISRASIYRRLNK